MSRPKQHTSTKQPISDLIPSSNWDALMIATVPRNAVIRGAERSPRIASSRS
jgi:hypothetical protein